MAPQRTRNWVFTLNNYTHEEVEYLKSLKIGKNHLRFLTFGKEVGTENGTPHLQGCLSFTRVKSLNQVKKIVGHRAYLCQMKGNVRQATEYCQKDGDIYAIGDRPLTAKEKGTKAAKKKAERNQILLTTPLTELVATGTIALNQVPLLKKAKTILLQEATAYTHDSVRGLWLYGPPGTGKTTYARETYPDAFIKAQNKWFDGYVGQKAIILDDLDTPVLGHYLKIWLDKWACSGEIKGGTVLLQHHHFVITSNYTPEDLWPTDPLLVAAIRRRCKFTHFENPFE